MSIYLNNPLEKVDKCVGLNDDGNPVLDDIEIILRAIMPHWWSSEEGNLDFSISLDIATISGGLTNKLYLIKKSKEVSCFDKDHAVIIRLYGAGSDLIIDRRVENCVFAQLSSRKISPTFFGLFQNGRVEEYLCGSSVISTEGMVDPNLYPVVAACMAKLHVQSMDMNLLNGSVSESNGCKKEVLWSTLCNFCAVVEERSSEIMSVMDNSCASGANVAGWIDWMKSLVKVEHTLDNKLSSSLRREMDWLHAEIKKSAEVAANSKADQVSETDDIYWYNLGIVAASEIMFCHNDLLAGNIMLQHAGHASSKVTLIDYEYAGYNCCAYDVANHFCEIGFAEVDVDVPTHCPIPGRSAAPTENLTLFPKESMRLGFIHHYLVGRQAVDSPTVIEPTAAMQKLDQIISAVRAGDSEAQAKFELVCRGFDSLVCQHAMSSCLLWGVWACIQCANSTIDFNYISFGIYKMGFDGYFGHKENYLNRHSH